MSLEVEATYVNGVLKFDQPLPLNDKERVTVRIQKQANRHRQRAGYIRWAGDPEILRRMLEGPEFGVLEPS